MVLFLTNKFPPNDISALVNNLFAVISLVLTLNLPFTYKLPLNETSLLTNNRLFIETSPLIILSLPIINPETNNLPFNDKSPYATT